MISFFIKYKYFHCVDFIQLHVAVVMKLQGSWIQLIHVDWQLISSQFVLHVVARSERFGWTTQPSEHCWNILIPVVSFLLCRKFEMFYMPLTVLALLNDSANLAGASISLFCFTKDVCYFYRSEWYKEKNVRFRSRVILKRRRKRRKRKRRRRNTRSRRSRRRMVTQTRNTRRKKRKRETWNSNVVCEREPWSRCRRRRMFHRAWVITTNQ